MIRGRTTPRADQHFLHEEAATQLIRERELMVSDCTFPRVPIGRADYSINKGPSPQQATAIIKLHAPEWKMRTDHIIAASLVLSLCLISAMALVTRILVHKHAKPITTTTEDGGIEQQHQLSHISSSWKRLFTSNQDPSKGHWVPTLSGIIKAGDEGLFSSTLFTTLSGDPDKIPLESVYEAFASELRIRLVADRPAYSEEISRFLAGTKRGAGGLGRAISLSHRTANGREDTLPRAQRKSLDLSSAEKGLGRALSTKKLAPVLVPMDNGLAEDGEQRATPGPWTRDGQIAEYHDGRVCVKITPTELAALSILLGSPLSIGAESDDEMRHCALGISISTTSIEGGNLHITLQQHELGTAHQHARGSGFSPLFAKHLAAGFLPYSQDEYAVNSIPVTSETFEAVQAGASLYPKPASSSSAQSRFLVSLPSSRELNFHTLNASTEQHCCTTLHSSTTLIDAVAALPFAGGLTPLASAALIKAVQFIASGGLSPARLLQRLEGLVDKVHRHTLHVNIFGPLYELQNAGLLYRETERLGKLATRANTSDSPTDKAARMSRYVTLLERLMALVPDTTPQDVLAAVREATRIELQRSYTDAVAEHAHSSALPSIINHTAPRPSAPRSENSSVTSIPSVGSVASPASSTTFPPLNLGKQFETVLKTELPFSVDTIAFVARMVIVAWTLSVETVAWEEGESGFKVPDLAGLGETMVLC